MLEACERFFSPLKEILFLKLKNAVPHYLSIYYTNLSQKLLQCHFIITLVMAQRQVSTSDQVLNSDS